MSVKPYYFDDLVTLYHGDCREILPTVSADVLVTDPPYGISWTKSENAVAGSRRHDGIVNDHDTSFRDWMLQRWGDKPSAVFGSLYAPFPSTLRHILIWKKPNDAGVIGSTTGYRRDVEAIFLCGSWPLVPCRWSSVVESCNPMVGGTRSPAGITGHPHAKPIDLMKLLIDRSSGVILDPFAGSGTTLIAAADLNRRAIGIEIEERYCEIAARRLESRTPSMFGGQQ